MNVLALSGSLRRASWNRLLLEAAVANAPSGMTIALYDSLREIPWFNEDLERPDGSGPEAVRELRDRVRAADAVLIATPEYNQSIPGVLKNALDWLSRPGPDEVLAGKPVAIMGATAGRWGTRLAQSTLRQVLHAMDAIVIPQPGLYVRDAAQAFDTSGRLIDPNIAATLQGVLRSLASMMMSARCT